MSGHIIAIDTYGAQRVTDPHTGKTISAYKLGYTSAVTAVLLALYGENARDVSPRQATYRYVQIDGDVLIRHGHILLTLTPDELAHTEAITRQHHRAAVYLWRDSKWWALPDSTHADYTEPGYRVGPTFDPTGFRPPSTGKRERAVTGIIVERSQREQGGQVWWWLNGDTYPHRELLKRHGARWSKKRQAWYWVGTELPDAIHALVTNETQAETQCEERSSLLAIFGGRIVGKERVSNGDTIIKGENGVFATRTTCIDRHDHPETVWEFDLPPHDRIGISLPAIHDVLKKAHVTFSIYTRKWHFEGVDKVSAMDSLAADVPFSDDDPCTVEEAAHLLGLPVKPVPIAEVSPRLFTLDQTVYARHELETLERQPIPTGTRGTVTRLYNHNAAHGWSCDVLFDHIGVCWCFERELTDYPPIPGIRIQRGTVVPPGAVLPPTDAEIKRDLIESGSKPSIIEVSAFAENDTELPSVAPETETAPAIRIIKPVPLPDNGQPLDAVQTAIHEVKTQPLVAPAASLTSGRFVRIDQSYVGELTGSITGQVFCYGYAVHDGVCVYVNMAGPRMGVEAIRAKLSKGDIVSVVPLDAPSVELTAGEGNSGMYHPYLHYLPEARFASLILVHDHAVTPNYGGKSTTFIFRTSDAQATAKLKYHVTQLVNIPVFDAWSAYLYEAGQRAMLVRKVRSAGGIDLLSVDLDVDAWTRLITGGLEQKIITLP
ncbi:MAG: hypothetical protein IAE80_06005 [Anaerolinea sp.]|nr:hypothetical protein [Anaerolinea sp.]